MTTTIFGYTGGDQTYSVPTGVTSITVKAWAGGGAANNSDGAVVGGAGGFVTAVIPVTPGESLTIKVGGGGVRNSTNGRRPGPGGGRSAVLRSSTPLVIVGAGGGAGGYGNTTQSWGGVGGGTTGGTGADGTSSSGSTPGAGGTPTAGGAGGSPGGVAGASLQGGDSSGGGAPYAWPSGGGAADQSERGGGGGDGYYGGGGGGGEGTWGAGGGGGSSYTDSSATSVTHIQGVKNTAPNTGDADYSSGVAVGGVGSSGGHGMVVVLDEAALDGVVDITAPMATVTAGYFANSGTAAIMGTSAVCSAWGGGTASIAPPAPTVKAFAPGYASIVAPPSAAYAIGHDGTGENSFDYTAPVASLKAYGGANASVAAVRPNITITGKVTVVGEARIDPPAATVAASGKVSSVGASALLAPMPDVLGYSGAVISTKAPGSSTVYASGTTGSVGRASISLPLFELTAGGTRQNSGSASLTAPAARLGAQGIAWIMAPGATLTAIGSATVAVTYEAYALNLKHANPDSPDELTRYTNYPFDKIVRYQNSYFGVNATGLYLLEGSTDFAEPTPTKVPWAFKTGMTDFDMPNLKTVNWAYFGGRMAPAATVSIHFGDTGEQSYAYATPRGASAQNYRQPFGRGIKSRYYALEAEGDGELSLDSLMFDIAKSARKV